MGNAVDLHRLPFHRRGGADKQRPSAYSNSGGGMMKPFRQRARLVAIALPCAILLGLAPSSALAASPCSFEPQGEGRVGAVIDARSFRMDDGREVRLAGIETVSDGTAALAALVANQSVTLRNESDAPDRYGRQPAFVFAGGSEISVQRMLLERGDALASGTVADKACA